MLKKWEKKKVVLESGVIKEGKNQTMMMMSLCEREEEKGRPFHSSRSPS